MAGVDDYGRRPVRRRRRDVVADGKLHVAIELVDAFVHTFIAAADEDYAVAGGDFAGEGLGEGAALGGHQDDLEFGQVALAGAFRFWRDFEKDEARASAMGCRV